MDVHCEMNQEGDSNYPNSYSKEVEEALSRLNLKSDSLDDPDFNVISYINERFPSEQSLANIDELIAEAEEKIRELDDETRDLLRGRWQTEDKGQEIVQDAKDMIKVLFSRIQDVQDRATRSEEMVQDITRDIQQLDQAKRNLTVSITALNNLILIVNAIDRLNELLGIQSSVNDPMSFARGNDTNVSAQNPFLEADSESWMNENHPPEKTKFQRFVPSFLAEISNLLAQVQRLLQPMLLAYGSVSSVAGLSRELDSIHSVLADRLTKELKLLLAATRTVTDNKELILSACELVDLLPKSFHLDSDIVNWFISHHLTEYKELFDPTQTTAWLDKIDQRYNWLRTNLVPLERLFISVFPPSWLVTERRLCILSASSPNRTISSAYSKSTNFVSVLYELLFMFISSCFDQFFDLYLVHLDKGLREQMTNRLIGDFTVNKSSLENRDLGDVFRDDNPFDTVQSKPNPNDPGENTLYSATDLFLFYKQILKQTLQLNRGHGLLGLVRLLRQYLSEYTVRVLLAQIPGLAITSSSGTNVGLSAPDVAAKMAAFGLSSLSALGLGRGQTGLGAALENIKTQTKSSSAQSDLISSSNNQVINNLLRDDVQGVRLSKDDVYKVCVILVTAAFCLKTVEDLEKRLKHEIRPPSWGSKISFASELDGLATCRSVCVHRLVADLEAGVEPQLVAMARLPWNNLVQVGDQSAYVTAIVNHLRTQVPLIRETLYTVRPAFTQICIKFADALIARFVNALYRCKPVNTFGAEQLLLDTQSLKASLLQMPLLGAKFTQTPPRSFTNLVHEGMGKAERIIKAVMLPVGVVTPGKQESTTPPNGFVMGPVDTNAANVFLASYEQLLPDLTQTDLQNVLDMKGVKSSEQQLILEIFRSRNEFKSAMKEKTPEVTSFYSVADTAITTSTIVTTATSNVALTGITTVTMTTTAFTSSFVATPNSPNNQHQKLKQPVSISMNPFDSPSPVEEREQITDRKGRMEKLLNKRR
ncbi:long-chain-fatty-acid--CoA ligase [Schistosoma mansoni]|uniref:long-chain-fatty-acid--CoA ligase n=1 Tax=Schistosoma mansoni TaxID=6183 RepID=UPI00022DCB98|nr:long-chain-fatty-acid--CoA ligase [Schistosoma mansoni]|eukprot:XP_018654231.1 long-chain-fatty-acid--CoA ligase [Schistosoma mansoni]